MKIKYSENKQRNESTSNWHLTYASLGKSLHSWTSGFPAAHYGGRSEFHFNESNILCSELQKRLEIQSSHVFHRGMIYAVLGTRGPVN